MLANGRQKHRCTETKDRSELGFFARSFILEPAIRASRHVTLSLADCIAVRAGPRLWEPPFTSFSAELSSTPHTPGTHSAPAVPSKELFPPSQQPALRDGDEHNLD